MNHRFPAYETGEDIRAPLPRNKSGADGGNRTRDLWLEARYVTSTPRPHISIYNGGTGWIRTNSPFREQIYSLLRLSNCAAIPLFWYPWGDLNSQALASKASRFAICVHGQIWWIPEESNPDLSLFRRARTPATPEIHGGEDG